MWILITGLFGCGDRWKPGAAPHTESFLLECAHLEAGCESCHDPGEKIAALDPACESCHLDDRTATHDPATTGVCLECHDDSPCGWFSLNPHPDGFGDPTVHGPEALIGGPVEGDCTACHGADLRGGLDEGGGASRGCDECHVAEGHADWRTDCTFCHGGELDATGAPPLGLPNDPESFAPHHAHVDGDANYRAIGCNECHLDHNDVLSPGHWLDGTPGAAEVLFTSGVSANTTFDGLTCTNNYCHGTGTRDDGAIAVDAGAMDCESCHATAGALDTMSGLHEKHTVDGALCSDCHAAIVNRDDTIATPARHVDGSADVNFFETTIATDDGGQTCAGTCHGFTHGANTAWGHVADYEKPELHGLDANLQRLDCGGCHGATWAGGVAQGCDGCHADEGHADWRTDCTFCHGGEGGDTDGLPPQDLDGSIDAASAAFSAHPDHHGTSPIGHPRYDCTECHVVPTTALSLGHAVDATPGRAEVNLSQGWSSEGAWDATSHSCSTMYCHGNGRTPSGTIADGTEALDCDSCHATTTGWTAMSGTHNVHLVKDDIGCVDCHAPVVDAKDQITSSTLHVNRDITLAASTGWDGVTCTNSCHGHAHDAQSWGGPHPDGFDAPEQHGTEALLRLQKCTDCHGADLRGGTASGCDTCHTAEGHADWRSDCTYCHGGTDLDQTGAPPEDIDGTSDPTKVSFRTHRAHLDNDDHAQLECATCHATASGYDDAPTDPGHWLLDATPQVAEVSFTGLGTGAVYAAGNCSNNYCHGDGRTNGESVDGSALTCDGCHSTDYLWTEMSGTHSTHLGVVGVTCADCHASVATSAKTILDPDLHVDGTVELSIPTMTVSAEGTCTGTCHSQSHTGWSWEGGHPPGFDAPEVHGQEALFQLQDCQDCHGADGLGGSSGQGCDSCHTVGWRTDCTFCHGGVADDSGAPPEDLDNNDDEASITFMAHPEHLDGDDHPTWDCVICHKSGTYTNAWTDAGHWWDSTPGLAEVNMSGGLSSASTYNAATSTCSNNYCHGTGKVNGSEVDSATGLGCGDCHGNPPTSGDHSDHKNEADCSDCHPDVSSAGAITKPTQHVNGTKDVADGSGTAIVFTYNGTKWTCNGSCHDSHNNETW